MPWKKEQTVMDKRKEFVEKSTLHEVSFSALCRKYGVSRKNGYKWLARAALGEGLSDRSRAPHTVPGKTPIEIEAAIVAERKRRPAWGAKKIAVVLSRTHSMPSVRTVNNILSRNGLIDPAESAKRKAYKRFERKSCNELWQADFKGDFPLSNSTRCHPLMVLDDCARFSLDAIAKPDRTGVQGEFERLFIRYGLPDAPLTDNDACFKGFRNGFAQFERWLMDLDVLPIHGRPYHPQTQGKTERLNQTFKRELLKYNSFDDILHAQKGFDDWRYEYNTIRPHEALGFKTPAEIYTKSSRIYCPSVIEFDYGEARMVKISGQGYLRYNGFCVYISETFANTYLAIRPSSDGSKLRLIYRNFKIMELDAKTGAFLNRSIFRLISP